MKQGENSRIAIHLYPKSARNAVEGWEEDTSGKSWLKVRVTAPPENGKANKALIKLLSSYYDTPKSGIMIVSGETSRYKTIEINRRD